MCKFGKQCQYGNRCFYAHSEDEMRDTGRERISSVQDKRRAHAGLKHRAATPAQSRQSSASQHNPRSESNKLGDRLPISHTSSQRTTVGDEIRAVTDESVSSSGSDNGTVPIHLPPQAPLVSDNASGFYYYCGGYYDSIVRMMAGYTSEELYYILKNAEPNHYTD